MPEIKARFQTEGLQSWWDDDWHTSYACLLSINYFLSRLSSIRSDPTTHHSGPPLDTFHRYISFNFVTKLRHITLTLIRKHKSRSIYIKLWSTTECNQPARHPAAIHHPISWWLIAKADLFIACTGIWSLKLLFSQRQTHIRMYSQLKISLWSTVLVDKRERKPERVLARDAPREGDHS